MRVRVEVTKNDIRRGRRCDSCHCPIARAVRRAVKGQGIMVHHNGSIDIGVPPSQKRERFIEKFDSYEPVEPIVFLMNAPKSVLS
jgi:hypothetical protein